MLTPGRPTAGAQTQHHGLRAFTDFAEMLPLAVILLAVLGLVLSLRPRSSMLRPVALAAAAAAAWVTILAIMVERGFTVIPRYLFMPAAFVAILAGIGMARAIELVGGTRPRSPRLAGAVVIAFAAAAGLSVSEFRLLRADSRAVASQAERDRDLATAVELAGGAEAVLACGSPVTAWFEKTVLAWELGVDLPDVSGRDVPGPQITFAYRGADASRPCPPARRRSKRITGRSWRTVATVASSVRHQRASSLAICSIADPGCCTQRDRHGILSTSHRSR